MAVQGLWGYTGSYEVAAWRLSTLWGNTLWGMEGCIRPLVNLDRVSVGVLGIIWQYLSLFMRNEEKKNFFKLDNGEALLEDLLWSLQLSIKN